MKMRSVVEQQQIAGNSTGQPPRIPTGVAFSGVDPHSNTMCCPDSEEENEGLDRTNDSLLEKMEHTI